MTVINLDPVSVRKYAETANEQFSQIRSNLETLAAEVYGVAYNGPNADEFRIQCNQVVEGFSKALTVDLQQISGAVSASTTNIAQALGGQPVTIEVHVGEISAPAPELNDGTVGANLVALHDLQKAASSGFNAIGGLLDEHMSALVGTAWQGQAKENALQTVQRFTAAAQSKVAEASSSISTYINDQVSALNQADA